ncbi:MAG: type II secretion system protein N [Pseudomonadota bacterium]
MNAQVRRLLMIGGAVFAVAMILHIPAGPAFGWAGLNRQIAMQGVAGTIWSGSASAASINGPANGSKRGVYLGRLRWQFQPLSLFLGRLEYLVEADGPTIAGLRGRISPASGGAVRLVATRGRARIDAVAPLLSVPMLGGLSGTVDFELDHVVLNGNEGGGWPERADGRLQLRTVSVPLLGSDSLGDFDLSFHTEQATGDVQVEYADTQSGPLALQGTATLRADGSLDRECESRARAGASTSLAQAAPLICSNDFF